MNGPYSLAPHDCRSCPRTVELLNREGWPDFTGKRFQPVLHRGRRLQWVVMDTVRGKIRVQKGGHQANAIYCAGRLNEQEEHCGERAA